MSTLRALVPAGAPFEGAAYRSLLLDLVVATAVGTLAWQYRGTSTAHVVLGVAMAVLLVARRSRSWAVMLGVAALALVQLVVLPDVPTGYDVAVLVAMVSVVSYSPRRWQWFAAGGIVLIGVVVLLEHEAARLQQGLFDGDNLTIALVYVLVCATAWLAAYAVRTSRIQAALQAERAEVAERERDQLARLAAADERAAIARELHDVVAHSLAVMIAQADGASYVVEQTPALGTEALRVIGDTGRDALDDMHRIVAVLRGTHDDLHSGPDDDRRAVGLVHVQQLAERARSAGLAIDLHIDGDTTTLSRADEVTLLRLVQESLTNSLRHAGPGTAVDVRLKIADGLAELEIQDDGGSRPLSAARTSSASGNGVRGMGERVAVHGGRLEAGPSPGGGWRVRASLPLRAVL